LYKVSTGVLVGLNVAAGSDRRSNKSDGFTTDPSYIAGNTRYTYMSQRACHSPSQLYYPSSGII